MTAMTRGDPRDAQEVEMNGVKGACVRGKEHRGRGITQGWRWSRDKGEAPSKIARGVVCPRSRSLG